MEVVEYENIEESENAEEVKLTPERLYGFVSTLLLSRYDNPTPIPDFHLDLWDLFCSDHKYVAAAAPRGHAKSTAVTHAFTLASVLFRIRTFVLIISDSETQASQFLGDIKRELTENRDLIDLFDIDKPVKETETDIVFAFKDGEQFRIIAKGSGQKLRGTKWRNKRPDLVIGDDLENDEIVLNEERRNKFRKWFFEAVIPVGSDNCIYRIVGTILHLDSLLERLMPPINSSNTVKEDLVSYSKVNESVWKSKRWRAHNEDFTKLLWPEKFSKEKLQEIRKMYVEQGNPEGYAQEYLNYPIDEDNAYFRRQDIIYQDEEDKETYKEFYAAADLAISEKDGRAYTAIVVAGLDRNNILHVVDVRRFRGDSLEIIEEIFSVHTRWEPSLFVVEQENIARSIGPVLNQEMQRRGIYINIEPVVVTQDKVKRARSIQARFKAGTVRIAPDCDWTDTFVDELLTFPKGRYMDQVDALAHIGMALDKMVDPLTKEELEDEEWEAEFGMHIEPVGRSAICGY